jgi:ATP-binding protein involved in chromosome partitioning
MRWSDGTARRYAVYELRVNCTCAQCKDEWSGKRLLDPRSISPEVYPKQIVPVGRYALQFQWSDGHDTGIYSFEHLYGLGIDIPVEKF